MRFVKRPRIVIEATDGGASALVNGDVWINSTDSRYKYRLAGATEELIPLSELSGFPSASTSGSSLIGVFDAGAYYVNTNVEDVLQEIGSDLSSLGAGLDWEPQVINILDTPPGSPSIGDRYIVGTSPTGAWVGEENSIAEWNGSSWDFTSIAAGPNSVNEGVAAFVQDLDTAYVVNDAGNWVVFGSIVTHNALGGLQGGNGSTEYYHLTQADHDLVVALDSTANGDGASLVATETAAFSFILNGISDVQSALNKLDLLGSGAAGEGASEIVIESGSVSSFLNGLTNLQQIVERVDTLGTTANGEGSSLIGIEDAGGYFTSTNVEGALQELGLFVDSGASIHKNAELQWTAGQTQTITHNLGSLQVDTSVQISSTPGASGGSPDEQVLATVVTNGSNAVDVTIDEAGWYFVTVVG